MAHPGTAPKWFEPTYEQRRRRTVDITRAAIDILVKGRRPVSLAAIEETSRHIDSDGSGSSGSAILRNPDAHALYAAARSWKAPAPSVRRPAVGRNPFTLPVKLNRRMSDSRRRLERLTKSELIEQLLESQNGYAVVRAAWLKASVDKVGKK